MEKNFLNPELFKKYLNNSCTAAELEQLFEYFGNGDQVEIETLIASSWVRETGAIGEADEKLLISIRNGLDQQLFSRPKSRMARLLSTTNLIRIAAILLVVASASLFLFNLFQDKNHVVPGSAKAMLNLGGQVTSLDQPKPRVLFRKGGITVTTLASGTLVMSAVNADSATAAKLNTITTPRGGEYKVTLSDGSTVVLNAGSRLTFPLAFRGDTRKVYIEGEAFFHVAKNEQKPFIVAVGNEEIKVLGTEFNVSNYPEDGGTQVSLKEGSVRFSNGNGKAVLMKPDQQVLSHDGVLELKNIAAEDFNAWTTGEFRFNDVPLEVVLQKLGRWYNVDVDSANVPQVNLYLKISRRAEMKEVLDYISRAADLKLTIKNDQIVIKK